MFYKPAEKFFNNLKKKQLIACALFSTPHHQPFKFCLALLLQKLPGY